MAPSTADGRYPAIDYIKAIAIVAVVVNHAGYTMWSPEYTAFDRFVRLALVGFHVPSFLVVSGFLYAGAGIRDRATLQRRLVRILPPYAVASVVVYALGLAKPAGLSGVMIALATGSALGIYYFVFALVASILLTFVLTNLSPRLPQICLAVLCVHNLAYAVLLAQDGPQGAARYFWKSSSFFWVARDPTVFYGYFLTGWVARLYWPGLRDAFVRHRTLLWIACILGVTVRLSLWRTLPQSSFAGIARAGYTLSVIGLIAVWSYRRDPGSVVRFASDSSYTLYLYHLPFILFALPYTASLSAPVRNCALALVALSGAGALAWLARRTLGPRAQLVMGA